MTAEDVKGRAGRSEVNVGNYDMKECVKMPESF